MIDVDDDAMFVVLAWDVVVVVVVVQMIRLWRRLFLCCYG